MAAVAFVGTVYAANWALTRWGVVSVAGLDMPAGVFFAGLAFGLRDVCQRFGGRALVVVAILAGAALSFELGADAQIPGGVTTIAAASCAAFLVSELADFAVYTPLADRSFLAGFTASNIVGTFVDSALFLWLAFGSLSLIPGQVAGKLLVTAVCIPFVIAGRRYLQPA